MNGINPALESRKRELVRLLLQGDELMDLSYEQSCLAFRKKHEPYASYIMCISCSFGFARFQPNVVIQNVILRHTNTCALCM